jgi:o-succinylbenzoate synthase
MMYLFCCRLYRRPFFRPLVTGHGSWPVREGIILQLRDEFDRCYWSEIAPLPQFGSETLAAAWEFCNTVPSQLTAMPLVPDELPATQFAFSALILYGAEANLALPINPQQSFLLPAGASSLSEWQTPWQTGHRTFKWKIGVEDIDKELELLQQLLERLPPKIQLRLDANGSLSFSAACRWLETCINQPQIEFVEQPVADLEGMMDLANRYPTALAIDELVGNLGKLKNCYERGWRGIYVVKPAIAGDLPKLSDFIQTHQLDVVVSSSLETTIGQNIIQRWAKAQGFQQRIPGMAVEQWFPPDHQWFADLLQEMRC